MELREVNGDIWSFDCLWRVIPTNGFVKNNGKAVMGAGLARQAAIKYPNLPTILANCIANRGSHVFAVRHDLITFPTKQNWWDDSDLSLITRSSVELVKLADTMKMDKLALPRVGCGNGGLRWSTVRPILEAILDERFTVVDNG